MIVNEIINRLNKYLTEKNLIEKNKRYLLAFSGGPDSVFLAYALNKIGFEFDLFYLNHQLRDDSYEEEKFNINFSKKIKKEIKIKRFNVNDFCKKNRLGIEEGARIIRRELLIDEYSLGIYDGILLAHTLDDLIENFFIRMFRGSGFGLPGMSEKDGIFIRPLIIFRKSEIINFLNRKKIPFYQDPTNLDKGFLRNRIRLEIIPLLENISPTGINGILKTIENIKDMKESFNNIMNDIKAVHYLNHIEFESDKFLKLPKSLQFLFLKNTLSLYSGELELKKEHLRKFPGKYELKNFIVEINENYGIIQKKVKLDERKIKIPESFIYGDFYLDFVIKDKAECYINNGTNNIAFFDYDFIEEPLYIRIRNKGDKMLKKGKKKEVKIKEIFIEKKVPRILRDFWPVICDKNGIIFIPFVSMSEIGKINDKTNKILVIKCRRIKNGWT